MIELRKPMIDIKENKKRRREIPSPFWIVSILETSAIVIAAATATEEKKKDNPETTIVATTTIVAKARVAVTTAA